jgi:glycine/D-amino acid oxidase-like deaminating enzyme
MRLAIVGGGVAGVLLAWRVRRAAPHMAVDLYTTAPAGGDATGASGGLVRGFERDAGAARLAAESLAELRADPELCAAAAYREVGSLYVLPPEVDPVASVASVAIVDERLPGSVEVLTAAVVARRYSVRGLPAAASAVVERHAGFLSPAALRAEMRDRLARDRVGVTLIAEPVRRLDPAPAVRLASGVTVTYDAVVVAAGAWTPGLLTASGLGAGGFTTKQIQYAVHPVALPGLGVFVDDLTGLYGRPAGAGRFLLGLPCDRWHVDPAATRPDPALAARVAELACERLGAPVAVPERLVAAADCYHDPAGLLLRPVGPGAGLFTFTGGSGGAAKTVLAASRIAAVALCSA